MEYIEAFGVLHPQNGSGQQLSIEGDTLMFTTEMGIQSSFAFNKLFSNDYNADSVFDLAVKHLVRYCLAGFNVTVVLFGSNSSPLGEFLTGENNKIYPPAKKNNGIIANVLKHLMQDIEMPIKGSGRSSNRRTSKVSNNTLGEKETNTKLSMSCFEISGDSLEDILHDAYLGLDSQEKSIGNLSNISIQLPKSSAKREEGIVNIPIENLTQGLQSLQAALVKSKVCRTAQKKKSLPDLSLFVEFYISHPCLYVTDPFQSCFRIVKLPAIERLQQEINGLESPNPDLLSFQKLLHPQPYLTGIVQNPAKDSVFTSRMKGAFGGNAFTSCIIGFDEQQSSVNSLIMSILKSLSNMKNTPVVNTVNVQNLIKRYDNAIDSLRETITELKRSHVSSSSGAKTDAADLQSVVQRLENEKVALMTENASLKDELVEMRVRFTEQVESKTHLSSRMVISEEEKLQMSRNTVELRLENNRIKQDTEKVVFELKKKCSSQQDQVKTLERQLALEKRKSQESHEELEYLRKEHKELTNEYVNIKHNHSTLSDVYERQVAEKAQLVAEIEGLINSKEELLLGRDRKEILTLQRFQDQLKSITKKTFLNAEEQAVSTQRSRRGRTAADLEKQLLVSNQEREEKLDNLRLLHNKDLEDFENRIDEIRSRLSSTEERDHRYKLKIAEQNAEKIVLQDKASYLESVCESQSGKIDQISKEYAERLQVYIQDLKEYVTVQLTDMGSNSDFITSLDRMLSDLKNGYNNRFEELESRLKKLLSHSEDIYRSKEKILASYKMLLWKVDDTENEFDINNLDLPMPTDSEINMAQARERNELQTKILLSEETIRELQVKTEHLKQQLADREQRIDAMIQGKSSKPVTKHETDVKNVQWHTIQKELREFTLNTQLELEQERADLLTRCQLSEEQLLECQAYIETYLQRYQQEVSHLRRLLERSNQYHQAEITLPYEGGQRALLPPLDRDHGRGFLR